MFAPLRPLKKTYRKELSRRNAYSFVRVIVVLATVAFAILTGWKGITQLRHEGEILEKQIAALRDEADFGRLGDSEGSLRELSRLESNRLTAANIGWGQLTLGAALYGCGLVCSGVFWQRCLVAFGHRPRLDLTIASHVLGQVGKYVPGKALVILIRTSAIHQYAGISRVAAAIAVFVETLTLMATGAAVAGVAVMSIPAPGWIRALAAALAISAAIPTLPPLFRIVLGRLAKSRFGKLVNVDVKLYDWKLMISGWGWMTITWLIIGCSFWLILLATPGAGVQTHSFLGFATALATICLAIVAGFMSLIPGGAGVREVIITALLAPLVGAGVALIAAVLARIVYLVVECIGSGLCWVFLSRMPQMSFTSAEPQQSIA